MKNFKKLLIWQKSMDITDLVFDMYEELPWQKVSDLKGQSTRAAVSIVSNIAEGNSRRSEKDKHRFMEMSLGSAFELETQTLVLLRRKWAPKKEAEQILLAVEEVQKMLQSFMSMLQP
ncbi:MAG: four helix bundle protein [Flavobacteriales bacterium]|nr:four helix bundle protein [Flavobacteriales bacterium]